MSLVDEQSKQGGFVLLADDSQDDSDILTDVFSRQKFLRVVDVVGNGEEAVAFLQRRIREKKKLPDLIVLDINMPKKNGLETLSEIKSNLETRRLPVIMLSGSTRSEDIDASYQLGAAAYFTKPMTFDSYGGLAATLDEYWGHYARLPKH